ncbi:hypothetical protein STABA_v1c02110 [Spiroplasma tabanidicola]|uniref:Uncharacterized protein n=1 Tax=Spiroplasma tabanidicola TaxID=324079 RepID=A0A6I6CBK7_9MOLU|nr:hypothetical protein STABA_v1c02110 [Spiroplasma tabanidicola]
MHTMIKNSRLILISIGSCLSFFINFLVLFFWKPIAINLNRYTVQGYVFTITYVVILLIWVIAFTCIILIWRRLSLGYIGSILALVFSIQVIIVSFFLLTWIFWLPNTISAIVLIVGSSLIIKDNRENL